MIAWLFLFAQAAPSAAPAVPSSLELVCRGGGAAHKADRSSTFVSNNNGGGAWATTDGSHIEQFEDQVDMRLLGDTAQIRLPRTMLPRLHGGDGGWFVMKDLVVRDDTIDGVAAVNVMNHPHVHLDRRTGVISIDGKSGRYTGDCERVDSAAVQRKF